MTRSRPRSRFALLALALVPLPPQPPGVPFPTVEWEEARPGPPVLDPTRLAAALDHAFAEPDSAHPRRTRAVLVVRGGWIVAERYAPGFGRESRLQGWSMTKSIMNALCGILVRDGKLRLDAPTGVPEWQGPGDPRRAVTPDMLLRASSGLDWTETYEGSPLESDVIDMLFVAGHRDMPSYAAAPPLAWPPDTHWSYSSGTSLVLSGIVRRAVGGDENFYHGFPRRELFAPLGMRSALLEPDASGTFVGSSYSWMTARDWARLGLLYLRDGVWDGRRILPEGWVDYTRTPTPAAPNGEYGAHFWLNAGVPERGVPPPFPRAPADLFYMSGHEGQAVVIVPSRDLVIVRLGLTSGEADPALELVADVVEAFAPVGE